MGIYLPGATATLTVQWVQYSGGPPSTVTGVQVKITRIADGATIVATTSTGVLNPATGVNTYQWVIPGAALVGDYLVLWTGTGPNGAVSADEVVTVTAASTLSSTNITPEWLLTVPYVTVASYLASPTYLDLQDLVSGSTSTSAQRAELNNKLLAASAWADGFVNQSIGGRIVVEGKRLRVRRDGMLSWHPTNNPVKAVTGLSYSVAPGVVNATAVTDLSGIWVEDGTQVLMPWGSTAPGWNTLQFGSPTPSAQLYTTWTYLAGAPNTALAASAAPGDTTIFVLDPTAIVPGDVLRIWEPGAEEGLTVASTYVIGAASVPLATPVVHAHTVTSTSAPESLIGVSQVHPDVREAVINYTTALLMRPSTTTDDMFPDAPVGVSTRTKDSRKDATGLVAEAYRLLRSYMRVR